MSNVARTNSNVAPYPVELEKLVGELSYRPGWTVDLDDVDRGQGSSGLTLVITTVGYDMRRTTVLVTIPTLSLTTGRRRILERCTPAKC